MGGERRPDLETEEGKGEGRVVGKVNWLEAKEELLARFHRLAGAGADGPPSAGWC